MKFSLNTEGPLITLWSGDIPRQVCLQRAETRIVLEEFAP